MDNQKQRNKIANVIIAILFFFSACILVYPTFTDSICDINQTMTIGGYAGNVENLSNEEINKLRRDAEEYNLSILKKQLNYELEFGDDYYTDEYDAILRVSDESDTMAYVEIPKINVYLPIVHGTNMNDLKTKIGHLINTSVPVGGISTHCVIAGHTGLVSAELFTNVEHLVEGDEVYIHVLNETLVYAVSEMIVVKPGEELPHLLIEEGKDLLTLYTCTPYGINDCRLLARCERTGTLVNDGKNGNNGVITSEKIWAIIHTILWGIIPIIVLIIGLYIVLRREDKNIFLKILKRKSK